MLQVIQNTAGIPFLKYSVKNHSEIKQLILDSINKMGRYSYSNQLQTISNTDYHLGQNFTRPYIEYIVETFNNVITNINSLYNLPDKLYIDKYWFQQYEKGDYHSMHIHSGCVFSSVYYVDIGDKTPKTTFELFDGTEIELNMNEGDILISPSYLKHSSKKNSSDKVKTIIAFNIN